MLGYNLAITLVEPGRPAAAPAWTDDDPQAGDARAQANNALAASLSAAFPGLTPVPDRAEDAYDLMEEYQPAEVMIRRFHRLRVLEGPCTTGVLRLHLLDGRVDATLTLDPTIEPGERLAQQIAALAAASGYMLVAEGQPIAPQAFVADWRQRHAQALRRGNRAQRWNALLARAGVPSLVLLTLLALLTAGAAIADGLATGRLVMQADPTRPMTFITTAVAPTSWSLGLMPRFHLDGVVTETGARVRLPVYRDQMLRAGPRAPFTVLPAPGAEPPYVMMSMLDAARPALTLGPVVIAWPALLAALPLGLWGWCVLRPWWITPAPLREGLRITTSRRALVLAQIGLLLAVALAARHFL